MIGGPHKFFRFLDPQCAAILHKRLDIPVGVLANDLSCCRGIRDDAVIHVGQVHHLKHLVAAPLQKSPKQVLEQ